MVFKKDGVPSNNHCAVVRPKASCFEVLWMGTHINYQCAKPLSKTLMDSLAEENFFKSFATVVKPFNWSCDGLI